MSARLIGELTEWLRTPAAADLTVAERVVLFVVAERAHEKTRIMLRHRADDVQLVERISGVTGMARDGALKKTLQRLARRGLDVRIPAAKGKDGRPVFAYEGHSMRFRLPEFPASAVIPERPAEPMDNPPAPVDDPVDNSAEGGPDDDQRGADSSPLSARGGRNRPASGDERGDESSRPTPSNYISGPSYKLYPSHSTSSVAEVSETLRPGDAAAANQDQQQSGKTFPFDQVSATALILRLPPEVQAAVTRQAEKELGPGAPIAALRIRAAEIASEGIPA